MRFSLWLPFVVFGVACTAAGCASSGAVPRPFPGAPVAATPKPAPPTVAGPAAETDPLEATPGEGSALPDPASLTAHRYDGRAVAEYAMAFRGVPYKFGGADPAGFDCSGLVQYVFAQYGVWVPRVVEEQWQMGQKIKPGDVKAGDLLFFSTKGPEASHVAIALDKDRFVHAPNSTGVVRVEALSSAYWGSHYIGARRISNSTTTD